MRVKLRFRFALILGGMGLVAVSMPSAATAKIISRAVSFEVQNSSRADVPCPTDGKDYTIRGHLTAPRSALHRQPRAVTLYLHGSLLAENVWRLRRLPAYDYARRQADAGHASVTIDQLGYGRSGIPSGLMDCIGGQADVAHQVIGQLRNGTYRSPTAKTPRFSRLALAGFSAGGLTAEVEASSFKDVDALVVVSFADAPPSPDFTLTETLDALPTCLVGGEPKRPGEPAGYVFSFGGVANERRLVFFNAAGRVLDAAARLRERDPCGGATFGVNDTVNQVALRGVSVPVDLLYGKQDAIFPPPDGELQKSLYSGSSDVTLVNFDNSGHTLMLQRTAPVFRATLSRWLKEHGF